VINDNDVKYFIIIYPYPSYKIKLYLKILSYTILNQTLDFYTSVSKA